MHIRNSEKNERHYETLTNEKLDQEKHIQTWGERTSWAAFPIAGIIIAEQLKLPVLAFAEAAAVWSAFLLTGMEIGKIRKDAERTKAIFTKTKIIAQAAHNTNAKAISDRIMLTGDIAELEEHKGIFGPKLPRPKHVPIPGIGQLI